MPIAGVEVRDKRGELADAENNPLKWRKHSIRLGNTLRQRSALVSEPPADAVAHQ